MSKDNIPTIPEQYIGTEVGAYMDRLYVKLLNDEELPEPFTIYKSIIEKMNIDADNNFPNQRGLDPHKYFKRGISKL